jgi:hypothetical protein
MASHWSFEHLQPKLWAKEGPGVKLVVWLPTTKSRESTSSQPPNWEYDTLLEKISPRATSLVQTSSRSDFAVGSYELPKSRDSTRDNFGTISGLQPGSPESPGKKWHSGVGAVESHRVYYREYGGGILLSPGRGESSESKCPWLVPTPKGVPECELTTWVVCFDVDSSLIY